MKPMDKQRNFVANRSSSLVSDKSSEDGLMMEQQEPQQQQRSRIRSLLERRLRVQRSSLNLSEAKIQATVDQLERVLFRIQKQREANKRKRPDATDEEILQEGLLHLFSIMMQRRAARQIQSSASEEKLRNLMGREYYAQLCKAQDDLRLLGSKMFTCSTSQCCVTVALVHRQPPPEEVKKAFLGSKALLHELHHGGGSSSGWEEKLQQLQCHIKACEEWAAANRGCGEQPVPKKARLE